MSEEDREARAALTRILEPGDAVVGRWIAERGAADVLRTLRTRGAGLPGVSPARWEGLRLRARQADPAADLKAVAAVGGRFVVPGDREWPLQLDDLGPARPLGLWVRGEPWLRFWALRSVAIVGARACTDYGAYLGAVLGAALAEHGWTVVSGGAYGVDAAAHRGALASDGATLGVLACGVDRAYPSGNSDLIGAIAARGLLVAELPPGDHPTRSRFLQRNRVIAALTRGTVVVEAQLRSGSLVTARWARDLERPVMGVPGPVTSGLSAGVHQLLRNEAQVVTTAEEIVELVGEMGELAPEPRAPSLARDVLPSEAARVLEALPGRGAVGVGDLAVRAAVPAGRVEVRLRELRCLGFDEHHGERWQLAWDALRPGTPSGEGVVP